MEVSYSSTLVMKRYVEVRIFGRCWSVARLLDNSWNEVCGVLRVSPSKAWNWVRGVGFGYKKGSNSPCISLVSMGHVLRAILCGHMEECLHRDASKFGRDVIS